MDTSFTVQMSLIKVSLKIHMSPEITIHQSTTKCTNYLGHQYPNLIIRNNDLSNTS